MHIGMSVKHPEFGAGSVKSLNTHSAEVNFNTGVRTLDPRISGLEPDEAQVAVTGLEQPLQQLIRDVAFSLVEAMGLERDDAEVKQLGSRWHGGKLIMQPTDRTLQSKEIPLEVFFHKVVMVRNNLRVLEQKINAHDQLSDGDKVEMQQYITRSYGSLTTFNILFKDKDHQFASK
jgi:hypothetical protein